MDLGQMHVIKRDKEIMTEHEKKKWTLWTDESTYKNIFMKCAKLIFDDCGHDVYGGPIYKKKKKKNLEWKVNFKL